MGLIDFVREAGESLLGKAKPESKVVADVATKRVHDLGLPIHGLSVEVDGDKAVVSGEAASHADHEKAVLAVGNIQGIAQVDDRLTVKQTAKPEPQSQHHRVVSGDTLSKIAKKYYGDAQKYPVIFEANKPMLKDPDKIYPGQVLRIPPPAGE